jgi:hypothetical protein
MYGRETRASGSRTAQIAPTPPASAPARVGGARSASDSEASSLALFPYVLVLAVGLYFVYALLEQHERFKNAIQPKAIGINFRNIAVIMVTVVLGLTLFKVGAIKLSAAVSNLTGGRVRLRWLVYLAGAA